MNDVESRSGDEAKKRVISHFRHEIRTSLTAIIGYSEHLAETLPSSAPGGMERTLKEMKSIGDALLTEVNARLSEEALQGASGDALPAILLRVSQDCVAPSHQIEPACAGLIARAERAGMYVLIPILCRIQAAGVMLNNLVKEYSVEVPTRDLAAGLGPSLSASRPAPPVAAALPQLRGRVLVVDDNSINRDLLRNWLTHQGHEVAEARGGVEGLAQIRRNDYDLILLDLVMPDKNGLEVLETLAAEGLLGLAPIIMLSASDELDGVEKCIERGADDYMVKPFHMVILKARIRVALELKGHRQRERVYLSMLKEQRDRG
jgi:sigma-B regulation protein RsbU (phosphoserine phosphatase)